MEPNGEIPKPIEEMQPESEIKPEQVAKPLKLSEREINDTVVRYLEYHPDLKEFDNASAKTKESFRRIPQLSLLEYLDQLSHGGVTVNEEALWAIRKRLAENEAE